VRRRGRVLSVGRSFSCVGCDVPRQRRLEQTSRVGGSNPGPDDSQEVASKIVK